MNLKKNYDAIRSREDLAKFIVSLSESLQEDPESWENADLQRFLDAMAAWVQDMDGYYINQGRPVPQEPSWKLIGDILMAAKVYE